jgi:topoisomerase IV subunit A
VLRHNTERLLDLLKRELEHQRHLLDELHAKTLVQIFVENRIYKRIEECKTRRRCSRPCSTAWRPSAPAARDVTRRTSRCCWQVPHPRISLFDINQNRKEIDEIVDRAGQIEKNLADAGLHHPLPPGPAQDHGKRHPRRTKHAAFEAVEVRELTANELTLKHDRRRLRRARVEGDPVQCSSLDKLILLWADGRYKVMPPPEKLFVDQNILYCAVFDRDR